MKFVAVLVLALTSSASASMSSERGEPGTAPTRPGCAGTDPGAAPPPPSSSTADQQDLQEQLKQMAVPPGSPFDLQGVLPCALPLQDAASYAAASAVVSLTPLADAAKMPPPPPRDPPPLPSPAESTTASAAASSSVATSSRSDKEEVERGLRDALARV